MPYKVPATATGRTNHIQAMHSPQSGVRRRTAQVVRWIVPPLILAGVRRLRHGPPSPPEWRHEPAGWPETSAEPGWKHASVADTQRRKWPAFRRLIASPNPLTVSHEAPEPDGRCLTSQTALLAYAYCLARTAAGAAQVSILDFGCGAGHYLPLSREILPDTAIQYTGYDLPHLCDLARELNPDGTFLDSAEACWGRQYDLVLVSGSLQYVRAWREPLRQLANAARGSLFVTRLPVTPGPAAFVVTQRAQAYGYMSEYSGWVFSRAEFLGEAAALGLHLEREFHLLDRPEVQGAPDEVGYRGFLFRRTS